MSIVYGEDALAAAIVRQACEDYFFALRTIRQLEKTFHVESDNCFNRKTGGGVDKDATILYIHAKKTIKECEKFFHSQWYGMLCSVDGEVMKKRIRYLERTKRKLFNDKDKKGV